MYFDLQPTLGNELVKLVPLRVEDLKSLYQVASDPLIWEQHPNKNRYQQDIFEKFFKGAIESNGAFLVIDNENEEVIGSSRYYEYDPGKKSIAVGYTFLARNYWGTAYNMAMKILMLDHAFKFADTVNFHIGAKNIRSQKAIEKLGAVKIGHEDRKSSNENNSLDYVYTINKNTWGKILLQDMNNL